MPARHPRRRPLRPPCWFRPRVHPMAEQARRRPILLIANPAAGGKPGGMNADRELTPSQLLERLWDGGLAVELQELAEDDDASALAKAAAGAGRDVVVAGGDGTVGPVAGGL